MSPKALIFRYFPELPRNQRRKDRDVIELIVMKTGWARPSGKGKAKREYMLRFLKEFCKVTLPTPAPKRKKDKTWAGWAWKPQKGRATKASDFYYSDEWRALRYKVLKKYGARCQCCGKTPRDGRQVHVDHIKPRSKYPELELEFSNLQVLCEDCNLGKLHVDETDWRPAETVLP